MQRDNKMRKVLVLTNSINGLYNFRKELIQNLLEEGYIVVIAAPEDKKTLFFTEIGCKCIGISINRRGANPISDIKLLMNYIKIVKSINPSVVLTYTIKPNIYGGLVCSLLNIPYIPNITGLGTSIENEGFLKRFSLTLYKFGLKKAKCVFFQNEANELFFKKYKIIKSKTRLIPGSGVNLDKHSFEKYPNKSGVIKFLFIGRIMKAKGIEELLKAAKKIQMDYKNVQFDIIGGSEGNHDNFLKELETNNILNYHGPQSDVHSFIRNSHAVINPSHHEGMSNVLLESASTGRPVIASNIPGCMETFEQNVSGIGFEVKNSESLINAIKRFIEMPYEEKEKMGMAAREKVEKDFDRNIVVNAYMDEINKIISKEN